MSNQQLLIGGVLLWFWMQRDKPEAQKIIVQKSSTGSPPATDGKAAAAAKLRAAESLEQTQEREKIHAPTCMIDIWSRCQHPILK